MGKLFCLWVWDKRAACLQRLFDSSTTKELCSVMLSEYFLILEKRDFCQRQFQFKSFQLFYSMLLLSQFKVPMNLLLFREQNLSKQINVITQNIWQYGDN